MGRNGFESTDKLPVLESLNYELTLCAKIKISGCNQHGVIKWMVSAYDGSSM